MAEDYRILLGEPRQQTRTAARFADRNEDGRREQINTYVRLRTAEGVPPTKTLTAVRVTDRGRKQPARRQINTLSCQMLKDKARWG